MQGARREHRPGSLLQPQQQGPSTSRKALTQPTRARAQQAECCTQGSGPSTTAVNPALGGARTLPVWPPDPTKQKGC